MSNNDQPKTGREAPLTAENAVQIARRAVAELATIPPDVTPTVDERGDEIVVTFPTNHPVGVRGADFHAQVTINKTSGVVQRILAGS